MIQLGKKNILGVWIDAVDYESAVEQIISSANNKRSMAVSALANHGIMEGVKDLHHLYRLNHLDLAVPDGQSVLMGLNWIYKAGLREKVRGPTLMLKVCEAAAINNLSIYLYGSNQNTLNLLRKKLLLRFPGIVIAGAEPSKFRRLTTEERNEVVQRVQESGASIVFVGLGCPRQEVWVYEYKSVLDMPLIAVGAAFDFNAGTLVEPPVFFQKIGAEWLFRFCQEPKRLWRRNFILSPLYFYMLFLQKFKLKKFDSSGGICPKDEILYG